jgi:hypothetical protein
MAERASERRERRVAEASERADAGAFLPRALEAEVAEWRRRRERETARESRLAVEPRPSIGAEIPTPRLAAAESARPAEPPLPGKEILTELREIRTWLAGAQLGIS